MIVNVKGFGKKASKELVEAAKFYADFLLHPRTVANIVLDIERDKNSDVMGEAMVDECGRNPRWFTINLRGAKDDDELTRTLAHEMVHIKQYAKNELGQDRTLTVGRGGKTKMATKWKGEWWSPNKKQDPYFDAPWEVEAYGMEVGMFVKWCNRNK